MGDQAWNNADLLWNNANTCTRIQKPDGGWDSLLEDKDAFIQKVNHLADLLACNMGDGQAGNVQNFDKDSCPGSDAANDTASDDSIDAASDASTNDASDASTNDASDAAANVANNVVTNVASNDQASCPVANPNSDTMTDAFKAQWEQTKDHLDDLTHGNRGAQIFRQYVETCEVDGNTATSSNELDMQIAQTIGGTTMFYNYKSSRDHLDIYGGDLLVIPSQYFKVVNDAKDDLQDADFHTLLAAMVESGLTKAINDGEQGKNVFPTHNALLMDSQGPGDRDYINMCLHLRDHVSVNWMHMHIYQDQAWNNADFLWSNINTCTRIQKPDGGWASLLEDKDAFIQKVNHLADLLECNMGDGQAGNVQNFENDSCPTTVHI